jgi:hypothetical protein
MGVPVLFFSAGPRPLKSDSFSLDYINIMQTGPQPRLIITLPDEAVSGFASLLQHGMLIKVEQPVALVPLLLSLPGFSVEYIENAVQTIFLNGVAVDSLDRLLPSGSVLALSAAMPGLAGAIFRRQGVHGSLRSRPQENTVSDQSDSGFITLKLFNSIASDRVLDLLSRGILISGKAFHAFAAKRDNLFQPSVVMTLDDQPMNVATLLRTVVDYPVLTVQTHLLSEN